MYTLNEIKYYFKTNKLVEFENIDKEKNYRNNMSFNFMPYEKKISHIDRKINHLLLLLYRHDNTRTYT